MLHSRKAARISPTLPGFDAAAALQRWKRLGLAGRERGDEGEGWSVVLPIRELVARGRLRKFHPAGGARLRRRGSHRRAMPERFCRHGAEQSLRPRDVSRPAESHAPLFPRNAASDENEPGTARLCDRRRGRTLPVRRLSGAGGPAGRPVLPCRTLREGDGAAAQARRRRPRPPAGGRRTGARRPRNGAQKLRAPGATSQTPRRQGSAARQPLGSVLHPVAGGAARSARQNRRRRAQGKQPRRMGAWRAPLRRARRLCQRKFRQSGGAVRRRRFGQDARQGRSLHAVRPAPPGRKSSRS